MGSQNNTAPNGATSVEVISDAPVVENVENQGEQPAANLPEVVDSNLPELVDNNAAVVVVNPEPEMTTFKMTITQKEDVENVDEQGSVYSIGFSLPKDKGLRLDYIIGTALDSLFRKMELAKATKTRLFDSRKPMIICVQSSQHSIDLGRIDQMFLKKMKVNNGERSKLTFIDRMIAITNELGRTITPIRATTLRENAKEAVQLRYGKEPKGSISQTSVVTLANSVLVVDEQGELAEA